MALRTGRPAEGGRTAALLASLLAEAARHAGYVHAWPMRPSEAAVDVLQDGPDGRVFIGRAAPSERETGSAAKDRLRECLTEVLVRLRARTAPEATMAVATEGEAEARLLARMLNALASQVGLESPCFVVREHAPAWMAVATWM